jgi:hypothetical protein
MKLAQLDLFCERPAKVNQQFPNWRPEPVSAEAHQAFWDALINGTSPLNPIMPLWPSEWLTRFSNRLSA